MGVEEVSIPYALPSKIFSECEREIALRLKIDFSRSLDRRPACQQAATREKKCKLNFENFFFTNSKSNARVCPGIEVNDGGVSIRVCASLTNFQ
jgi:hypothetical protein